MKKINHYQDLMTQESGLKRGSNDAVERIQRKKFWILCIVQKMTELI